MIRMNWVYSLTPKYLDLRLFLPSQNVYQTAIHRNIINSLNIVLIFYGSFDCFDWPYEYSLINKVRLKTCKVSKILHNHLKNYLWWNGKELHGNIFILKTTQHGIIRHIRKQISWSIAEQAKLFKSVPMGNHRNWKQQRSSVAILVSSNVM